MPPVTLRDHAAPTAVLRSGETLLFGALPEVEAAAQLRFTALDLPRCAPHVWQLLGELSVGEETWALARGMNPIVASVEYASGVGRRHRRAPSAAWLSWGSASAGPFLGRSYWTIVQF